MAKTRTRYVCQECGHASLSWLGRCPECEAWNSLVEEVQVVARPSAAPARASIGPGGASTAPVPITRVAPQAGVRVPSGISELDRVLGGGIVPGSLVLVGGDPGIGKSTLLTQVAHGLSTTPEPAVVLYVSGEESAQQIRLRAERLGALSDSFLVVNETDLGAILHHVESLQPALVIVDSIQTTYDSSLDSAPGTVSQVRNCAGSLSRLAKTGGPTVVLIGHVTKEGSLAGPRVLEHMVDTVLYFEGDRRQAYRILRAVKNRFGSTDEIGLFEMREEGLIAVDNPSAALLAERTAHSSGSAVTPTMEGTRSLLVEVQALVTRSFLANPRRTATGIDLNRLNILLAVLEKRVGLRLGDQDVFVNVAGGMRILEPAADLAVTLAIASNFREEPIDATAVVVGEVGLAGEVRAVSHCDRRLREAARLGFTRGVVPRANLARLPKNLGLEVIGVAGVFEAMQKALKHAS